MTFSANAFRHIHFITSPPKKFFFLVAHFRATFPSVFGKGENKKEETIMERIDMLDAIARMLVHLSDEDVKTVYEFVLTISK